MSDALLATLEACCGTPPLERGRLAAVGAYDARVHVVGGGSHGPRDGTAGHVGSVRVGTAWIAAKASE